MVQFHALGGVSLNEDGTEVGIGGPRQRRLLAMLLIHRNRVVSVDRLAEAVFAGEPTPAASTTLRSYIARIRKVVDGSGSAEVVTQAPGYVLRLPAEAFDVARFEAAVADASALPAGEEATAAAVLRDALGLWRGDPYAEFADEDWARPEAQRLIEVRLVALERLYDAELACGRAVELIPELDSLVAEHPLRDGFRAQLVLALYRAGRQADALQAITAHRAALVEELGLDPAPALQDLERRILDHDPTLLLDQPAGLPLRGYRLGERLGTGRDGTVYAARLPGVERDMVIRVLRSDIADEREFVRSFDVLAHRVASLRHPAVVTIHDYWREPGAAYVVMRRMHGGTLADRLEQAPLRPEEVAAMVRRAGGALTAAAEAGITHGRLDPHNVLFDGVGDAYLSDFDLVGPAHRPTELACDVEGLARLVRASLAAPAPAVEEVLRRADSPLDRPSIGELVPALVGALDGGPHTGATPANPYKGLRAFDEADAADYFGRAALIEEILDRLRGDDLRGRLVLVVGGSGTGKSSAVRAGLLPRVRAGEVPGSNEWFVATMLPGSTPFKELAESLRQVAVADAPEVVDELTADAAGLDRVLRRLLAERGQLLLVVDQLEELFTSATGRDQRAFLDSLLHAISAPDSRLRVVATLRADFFDRPLRVPGFGAAVNDATVTIAAMSPAELEAAIVEPAQRLGRRVERPLVAELISAVVDEPAALPSLQFTLYELAERCGDTLTQAVYEELGAVEGAIAARAEALYRSLEDDERSAVRGLFEELVVVGTEGEPTRRRASRTELTGEGAGPGLDVVIDRWSNARLLSLDRHPQTRVPTVELAHEALLREWPRLRGWIEEDREALRVLGHLRDASRSWRDLDRDPGALYRGARLEVALDVTDARHDHLPELDREFMAASRLARDVERQEDDARIARQARANRRLRAQLGVIAVALVVALVGGYVAVDQRGHAEQERRIATARELAAASDANLDVDPERSVLLALEAIDATRAHDGTVRREAVESLHQAVATNRLLLDVPGAGGALDWSPDGTMFATEGPEETGLIDIRDAETGEPLHAFVGHEIDVNTVAFSADSSMLATAGDDGFLRVWDARTGDLITEVGSPDGGNDDVWAPSFSPDGTLVAAAWSFEGALRLMEVATGTIVAEVEGVSAFSTDFSPDGTQLAIARMNGDGPLVGDIATGEVRFLLGDERSFTRDVRFSPDGRWIATADEHGEARIWSAATGEQHLTVTGHSSRVNTVDWSADSTLLATSGDDGTARVHEISDGSAREIAVVAARDTRNGVAAARFSPEGDRIMTGDWGIQSVKVWDITPTGAAAWLNAPTRPFTGGGTFTPDSDTVAVSTPEGDIALWDATSGERLRVIDISGHHDADEYFSMALNPDGEVVATVPDHLPLHLWDTATGEHLSSTSSFDGAYVIAATWNHDGTLLGLALDVAGTGHVVVLDRAGREVASFEDEPGYFVVGLTFSPDGDRLAGTRYPQRHDPNRQGFRIWDWRTGDVELDVTTQAERVTFDPTGTRLATARSLEGVTDVWDAETGDLQRSLPSASSVYGLAFNSDGTRLATAEAFGTVRLWDPRTGTEELVLRGHQRSVNHVHFSPDGSRLSSIDESGLLRVWALDLDELIALATERLTRPLDDDECRQYLHVDGCRAR